MDYLKDNLPSSGPKNVTIIHGKYSKIQNKF